MRVRNQNLAGASLRLRNGALVRGDAEGYFEVSDDDGKALCATPGWSIPKKARDLDVAPAVETAPKPVPAPPSPPEAPQPAVAPVPEPPEQPEQPDPTEGLEEGPDLDAMTKAELLTTAEEYAIEVDDSLTKAQIRKILDKAIYGTEE